MARVNCFLFVSVFLLLLAVSPAQAVDRPLVFVSIVPQKFFVQQICKERLQVEVMVQPGASPATYEPKASQMKGLAKSDAYFAIGVPFERSWLAKIQAMNPQMALIHTDQGIKKRAMAAHHHHGEGDGHDDHHGHHDHDVHHHGHHGHKAKKGLDPHIWLSPQLVKVQAATIKDALQKLYPQHGEFFEANFRSFMAEVDQLHSRLQKVLAGKQGRQFMVFHPSWGYFADDYGLQQVAIEVEGKNPKPAQLRKLIKHAKSKEIRVIFAQPQFSAKSAKVVAREIKGEVLMLDPLAEEWLSNLAVVADKMQQAMR